jgi:hypothetical protein
LPQSLGHPALDRVNESAKSDPIIQPERIAESMQCAPVR